MEKNDWNNFMNLTFMILEMNNECKYRNEICKNINGNQICVIKRKSLLQQNKAFEMIRYLQKNLVSFSNYLYNKFKNNSYYNPRFTRLNNTIKTTTFKENNDDCSHTSYSEDKGKILAFCLQDKERNTLNDFEDLNTLMFVGLHEITHIACSQDGHPPEFWSLFKKILIEAEKFGIYNPVNYNLSKHYTKYCGMTIDDSPYHDPSLNVDFLNN